MLRESSVQFSCSVVPDSLRPHESQHARPPCPSPTPGVHSDPSPSSPWCHPAISSSVVPFSCSQFLSASESFPTSQLFTWGGQSTGASALASFLSKKSQGWSPSEWIEWFKTQEFIITIRHFLQGLHAYLRNNNTTTNLGDSVKYILWKEWTHIFYYPVKASLLSILTKSN